MDNIKLSESTPIQDLKDGLSNRNWASITSAYAKLTGEFINVTIEDDTEQLRKDFLEIFTEIYKICEEYINSSKTKSPKKQKSEEIRVTRLKSKTKQPPRPPPKKYKLTCSYCDREYESYTNRGKDISSRCPKCLNDLINNK